MVIMRNQLTAPKELWMHVYIVGPESHLFPEALARMKCWKADSIETADAVLFTGGPDLDPMLFGEAPRMETHEDKQLTKEYVSIFLKCQKEGIPMIGVCLGAQFLSVMLGASLYQHVTDHHGDHNMYELKSDGKTFGPCVPTNSVHHQAIRNNFPKGQEVQVLTGCRQAKSRFLKEGKIIEDDFEVESFWHDGTCAFGVQGHPEYAQAAVLLNWVSAELEDKVLYNPRMKVVDKMHRLPKENRKWKVPTQVRNYIKKEKIECAA